MADRVGQTLGNYQLEHLLGEGGFAEVYLGEHLFLKTKAAIKVLHTRLGKDELEGFLAEARTIAMLKHPHIVRVLDFGVEGSTPFLVMDYAPNGTLRERFTKGAQLPLATILPLFKQVADALQYAHDQRLIHRDIKPENMLLDERGQVVLSDFGIATVAQSSRYQQTGDVAGTAAYMAPEQLQGKPRPASDQYALGIVVYEWLTGTRPFQGSFPEIASQHVLTPPPPLREKLPTISSDVEQVVLTALAKDPKERFASVQAFATAFEQASEVVPKEQFSVPFAPSPQPAAPSGPIQELHQPAAWKNVPTQITPQVGANATTLPVTLQGRRSGEMNLPSGDQLSYPPFLPPTIPGPPYSRPLSPLPSPDERRSPRRLLTSVLVGALALLIIGAGAALALSHQPGAGGSGIFPGRKNDTATPPPSVTDTPTPVPPTPTNIPQSTSVTVSATNANGTPTGINVVQGQSLTFHASGYWCSGGIKQDGSASCGGPEGIRPADPGETDLVLPNQLVGLLLGRIGTWVFPIGSSTQITAQASGQLYLLMNDRICCYADNSGQVIASITRSGASFAKVFLLAPGNHSKPEAY